MRYYLVLFFSFSLGLCQAQETLLEQKELVVFVNKTLYQIYNFEFEPAEKNIRHLEATLGSHPGLDLLNAIYLYWKYYPVREVPGQYQAYESYLLATMEKAEVLLEQNENDVEGIFFAMAANGYLTNLYIEQGNILKGMGYAKSAYNALKKGFELKQHYEEFYFTTGLYNYYREKYPENHPAYKPLTWFFQRGDKPLGIKQLQVAYQKAVFTRVEALYYLFHIYLRYEVQPDQAFYYARDLYRDFPGNTLFQTYYVENLLAREQYIEAVELSQSLLKRSQSFYQLPGHVFMGMIREKQFNQTDRARENYETALKLAERVNLDTDHYQSMAWLGLGRLALQNNDDMAAKQALKNCLKLSQYDIVTDEANHWLDSMK
ncbi:MAG: tetratricopeptide repeat protein [Candidatus Cyclobacteriaceae bacterium M3_2C_046]